MTREPEPRVLVPFRVLEDTPHPEATVGMVASVDVILLGYHRVPEQTAPGQMRMQYEDEALAEVDDVAGSFREAGGQISTRVVFTGDPRQTFERIAHEERCTSVLLPRPAEEMRRLLVPMRGEVNLERLVHVTARLLRDNDLMVTLIHMAPSEEAVDEGQMLLEGARSRLVDAGVDQDRVTLNVGHSEDPLDRLVEAAEGFDGLILGEAEPSIHDVVFGEASKRIAEQYDGPILIVRHNLEDEVPVGDEPA